MIATQTLIMLCLIKLRLITLYLIMQCPIMA